MSGVHFQGGKNRNPAGGRKPGGETGSLSIMLPLLLLLVVVASLMLLLVSLLLLLSLWLRLLLLLVLHCCLNVIPLFCSKGHPAHPNSVKHWYLH